MILAGQQQLLNDFYESVVGLRTGETGRANTHLHALIQFISAQLALMSLPTQQRALPVIQKMLSAKERDDRIALADSLQYELPETLEEAEFSPSLLDITIIQRLNDLLSAQNNPDGTAQIAAALTDIYRDNQQVAGLGTFYAGPLFLEARYDEARQALQADESAQRRTPAGAYMLALLEARDGDEQKAADLMAWAYSHSQALRDGFAQLAWTCYENKRFASALTYARREMNGAHITPGWQANLAQIYALGGEIDTAESMVADAYEADAELRDAYAGLGWLLAERMDWAAADRIMSKDLAQERIGAGFQCYLAMVQARLGRWDDAQQLVADAYAKDPDVNDGYSRIGWAGLLADKGADFLQAQLEKDRSLGRYATMGRFFNTVLAAAQGRLDDAIAETHSVYADDRNEKNWLSVLGWLAVRRHDRQRGSELFDQDHARGRMNRAMFATYAAVLSDRGRSSAALQLLDPATGCMNPDEEVFIGFRLRPDARMPCSRLRTLVADGADLDQILAASDPVS